MTVEFSGTARRLTARDVEEAAHKIGCEVAALRAVLSVESRGSGFDEKRRPTILFEPHVFYRNLPPGSPILRQAIAQGLAYKEWRRGNYPKGSAIKQADGNYDRLARAAAISEEAAFRAISIGMGQVLGENFRIAGHLSAVDMFEAAKQSEAAQLADMLGFIRGNRLDDDLRRRDWQSFARGYNGDGQVAKYASWLAREYAKWAKIVDKPREELTARDLHAAGSQTIAAADKAKTGLAVASTAAASAGALADQVNSVVEPLQAAASQVDSAHTALQWLQDNWQVVGVIVLAILAAWGLWSIWRGLQAVEEQRVQNARDGVNSRI